MDDMHCFYGSTRGFYSGIVSPPKSFEKNFIGEKAGYSSFSISNENPFEIGACSNLNVSMSEQKREYSSNSTTLFNPNTILSIVRTLLW